MVMAAEKQILEPFWPEKWLRPPKNSY
jgi:hypothetical protein